MSGAAVTNLFIAPRHPIESMQLSHYPKVFFLVALNEVVSGIIDKTRGDGLRCLGAFVFGVLCIVSSAAIAQAPGQAHAPATFECAANARCNMPCSVDGEKVLQTGAPKTITVTMLAPGNYLVDLVEQNGHIQSAYPAGAKTVCSFDGMTKTGG